MTIKKRIIADLISGLIQATIIQLVQRKTTWLDGAWQKIAELIVDEQENRARDRRDRRADPPAQTPAQSFFE